ncbi:MAG: PKD domain-containing protein [Phycisphaerae bacterium]
MKQPLVILLLGLSTTGLWADTLGDGWGWRRELQVKVAASKAPGSSAAYAEFRTEGSQLPDGKDIRVTTAERNVVPSTLLLISNKHDFVRLAFATPKDGPYYVWWGNPKVDKPAPELDLQRGLLVEQWTLPANQAPQPQAIKKWLLGKPAPVWTGVWDKPLKLGWNPLGEDLEIVLRYRGQFLLDRAGTFHFAFAADDAGYLSIDGKQILQHQGVIGRQIRHQEALDLSAGWHTLDAIQINANRDKRDRRETGLVAAWQTPGAKHFESIPANVFAPLPAATVGILEQTGTGKTGDFEAYPAAEAFIPPEHYVQRWIFSGQVPPEWKAAQWQWDFGDDQTATGAATQHVFLTEGVYPVKLTIKSPQKTVSVTQRIWVRPRLYEQFPKPEEDRSSVLLAELSHYNPLLLSTNAAYRGMLAYKSADNRKEYQRWMEAWLTACVPTETPQLMNALRDYAHTMTQAGAAEALVGSLKLLHAKKLSSLVRAQAALLEVTALTEELSQPQVAQAVLDQCKPQLDPERADAMHHFQVAQALTYIAAGKGKQCLETIKELGPRKNLPYNEIQMRQGVLARNIESFIAEGEFEPAQRALEQWEMDVPDTIPEGFSRVLKVKLYMAQKRYQTAIVIALQHAKALPDAYYAAELLWRAAEAQIKSSNLNEAKALQQLIREKYPESPWARQATTLPQAN